jgi:hypothetical protein
MCHTHGKMRHIDYDTGVILASMYKDTNAQLVPLCCSLPSVAHLQVSIAEHWLQLAHMHDVFAPRGSDPGGLAPAVLAAMWRRCAGGWSEADLHATAPTLLSPGRLWLTLP